MDDSFKETFEKSMNDFQNRTRYTSLDTETFRGIPDDKLEQAVVDYVTHKLETGAEDDAALKSLASGCRAFWFTWIVDAEVRNGGFNQYYWNTRDRYSSEAVDAFEFFSATEHAALMRQANYLRAQEAARIKEFQDKNTLEAFSESYKETNLGPIDTQYYALKEDLSALRIAKIRETPELFSGD